MSKDNIIQFPTDYKGDDKQPHTGVSAVDALRICVDHAFDSGYIDTYNATKLMVTLDMFEDMQKTIERLRDEFVD
tara:strand:- start:188 stop:412 length:225 start_codon:yes stop_codon:yes gene_type:complete